MQNTVKFFADVIKGQGVAGVLAIIIWIYGSAIDTRLNEFNSRLNEITKEIVSIKIELASMNASYIDKDETRRLIDQAIGKHLMSAHGVKTNSNN